MKIFKDIIKELALKAAPYECCGLLLRNKDGMLDVVPTANAADDPVANFQIPLPAHYEAIRTGRLMAAYHSHPRDSAEFSDVDKAASDNCGIPFYVYSIPEDRFNYYAPGSSIKNLIGRSFAVGVFDCAAVVIDYHRLYLGVNMPYIDRDLNDLKNGYDPVKMRHYLNACGFVEVDDVKAHTMICMSLNGAGGTNHFGMIDEDLGLIHQLFNKESNRESYFSTSWERATVVKFRHKSVL